MKKIKLTVFFCFLFTAFAFGQKAKTVTVSTLEEFIREIESDKIIRIKGERLIISNLKNINNNNKVALNPVFDGLNLEISQVKNLKIIGAGTRPTKIISNTRYAHILTFRDCENISIENVEAGHGPGKGYCTGGVFAFFNTRNLTLLNCTLFGSGTEGLSLEGVSEAKFDKITVKSCTYGIMTLANCRNISFSNSRFSDNQEFDLINISDSEGINFSNCIIDFNRTGQGQQYDSYALFNVPIGFSMKGDIVTLTKCIIEDNYCQFFCRSATAIKTVDCQLDNNIFEKGYNSNK